MTAISVNATWGSYLNYSNLLSALIKRCENNGLLRGDAGFDILYVENLRNKNGPYQRLAIGYGYDLNARKISDIETDLNSVGVGKWGHRKMGSESLLSHRKRSNCGLIPRLMVQWIYHKPLTPNGKPSHGTS